MKAGDQVGAYTLLEDFRVVGAGLSEWSFAERDGLAYFIKRFLSPTYPDDDAPGSAQTKARKRARCAAFESHHRGIQVALAPVTRYGGNLISPLDFFRVGAKYYKITEKVDVAGLDPAAVTRLPFPTRLILLKTVAHSLRILHDMNIVHSDLKPSNVLIKKTELGYTTKLIDFDSSYIVGSPPPPDEIVGTMNYYSPELVRYIQEEGAAVELTAASDIFALGLIYSEYLSASLPGFDPEYHNAAVAALNGAVLRVPAGVLPASVVELVEQMLLVDPAARPTVQQVHARLMGVRGATATVAVPLRLPPARSDLRAPGPGSGTGPAGDSSGGAGSRSRQSTLRGKGVALARRLRPAAVDAQPPAIAGAPDAPPSLGLVGRLASRLDRRGDR